MTDAVGADAPRLTDAQRAARGEKVAPTLTHEEALAIVESRVRKGGTPAPGDVPGRHHLEGFLQDHRGPERARAVYVEVNHALERVLAAGLVTLDAVHARAARRHGGVTPDVVRELLEEHHAGEFGALSSEAQHQLLLDLPKVLAARAVPAAAPPARAGATTPDAVRALLEGQAAALREAVTAARRQQTAAHQRVEEAAAKVNERDTPVTRAVYERAFSEYLLEKTRWKEARARLVGFEARLAANPETVERLAVRASEVGVDALRARMEARTDRLRELGRAFAAEWAGGLADLAAAQAARGEVSTLAADLGLPPELVVGDSRSILDRGDVVRMVCLGFIAGIHSGGGNADEVRRRLGDYTHSAPAMAEFGTRATKAPVTAASADVRLTEAERQRMGDR